MTQTLEPPASWRATRAIAVVLPFALTMFLSAFLLFSVEPLVAKMVLPALGGAPMVCA